jgi:hypothetical protein
VYRLLALRLASGSQKATFLRKEREETNLGSADATDFEDLVRAKVALRARCRAQKVRFVGLSTRSLAYYRVSRLYSPIYHGDMHAIAIRVGKHGDAFDPERLCRPHHPAGDLASVERVI